MPGVSKVLRQKRIVLGPYRAVRAWAKYLVATLWPSVPGTLAVITNKFRSADFTLELTLG